MRRPRQCGLCASQALTATVLWVAEVSRTMDAEAGGNAAVDRLQEVEDLPGPVTAGACADDEAGGDIKGSQQRGGAGTRGVVCASLGYARQHRQDSLQAVKRLQLALLLDPKHKRTVRRREIEPDEAADLVHEHRVTDRCVGSSCATVPSPWPPSGSTQWVASGGRGRMECPLNDLGHLVIRQAAWPARPRLVRQAVTACRHAAAAPFADRVPGNTQRRGDCLVRPGRRHNAGSYGAAPPANVPPEGTAPDAHEQTAHHPQTLQRSMPETVYNEISCSARGLGSAATRSYPEVAATLTDRPLDLSSSALAKTLRRSTKKSGGRERCRVTHTTYVRRLTRQSLPSASSASARNSSTPRPNSKPWRMRQP